MDTVEARNLNRLRRGEMMLEYGKVKKSYIIYTLLLVLGCSLGAHRFYLGHKLIGIAILSISVFIFAALIFGPMSTEDGIYDIAAIVVILPILIFIIELILMTWTVGRENARIQARLATEYDVKDYKVIP